MSYSFNSLPKTQQLKKALNRKGQASLSLDNITG